MDPSIRSKGHYKLPYLKTFVELSQRNYPIIALTETWLNPSYTDAQVHWHNFQCFRSDRIDRIRGGALLYISNQIPITKVECFNDDVIQSVVCLAPTNKMIIACVYKPPDASLNSFRSLIKFLQDFFDSIEDSDHYT